MRPTTPPKKKLKAAKSPAPKKKAKTKTVKEAGRSLPEFPGFPACHPPVGHLADFNWGGGWHEGKFKKMEVEPPKTPTEFSCVSVRGKEMTPPQGQIPGPRRRREAPGRVTRGWP
jgi:hypothetical protein